MIQASTNIRAAYYTCSFGLITRTPAFGRRSSPTTRFGVVYAATGTRGSSVSSIPRHVEHKKELRSCPRVVTNNCPKQDEAGNRQVAQASICGTNRSSPLDTPPFSHWVSGFYSWLQAIEASSDMSLANLDEHCRPRHLH